MVDRGLFRGYTYTTQKNSHIYRFLIDAMGKNKNEASFLLIDDDLITLEFMSEAINKLYPGSKVDVFNNGLEIEKVLQDLMPDVVLLDLHLPGKNGFDICRAIKQFDEDKSIKVIVMTGYDSKENKEKAFNHGAEAYLSKPFEEKNLVETLLSVLPVGNHSRIS